MSRAGGLLALLLLTIALATPAAAIETTEFGIEPAAGATLEVEVRAGRTSTVPVRLWNQSDHELDLRLQLSPATVHADGIASLEGEPEPVAWAELETRRVVLAAADSRVIEIRFHPPSPLAAGEHTIAVIAQASPPAGSATASVVQRLAPVVYVHALESVAPESGALGIAAWIAGALAALAAVATAVRAKRSRGARH